MAMAIQHDITMIEKTNKKTTTATPNVIQVNSNLPTLLPARKHKRAPQIAANSQKIGGGIIDIRRV